MFVGREVYWGCWMVGYQGQQGFGIFYGQYVCIVQGVVFEFDCYFSSFLGLRIISIELLFSRVDLVQVVRLVSMFESGLRIIFIIFWKLLIINFRYCLCMCRIRVVYLLCLLQCCGVFSLSRLFSFSSGMMCLCRMVVLCCLMWCMLVVGMCIVFIIVFIGRLYCMLLDCMIIMLVIVIDSGSDSCRWVFWLVLFFSCMLLCRCLMVVWIVFMFMLCLERLVMVLVVEKLGRNIRFMVLWLFIFFSVVLFIRLCVQVLWWIMVGLMLCLLLVILMIM